MTVPTTFLLWRLARAPLDVTSLARRWLPLAIVAGADRGAPAGRLDVGTLAIAWKPSHRDGGLVLQARDLRVLRRDGSTALSLSRARLVLEIAPLLIGRVAPREVEAEDMHAALSRRADGAVTLDLPGARADGNVPDLFIFRALTRVHVARVTATLEGFSLHVSLLDGLRQAHRRLLWDGNLAADLVAPGKETVTLDGHAEPASSGVRWHLASSAFEPQIFSPVAPELARWHVPLAVTLDGVETEGYVGGVLRHRTGLAIAWLAGRATLGAGQILQEGAPLQVNGGGAALSIAPTHPGERDARLALRGGWIALTGAGNAPTRFTTFADFVLSDLLRPRRIDGSAHVEGSSFEVGQLGAIWPQAMLTEARKWVTRNIVAGHGSGLAVTATLHGDHGWPSLQPVGMRGALHLEDATTIWLPGMPPAEHLAADLDFAKPDTLRFVIHSGVQPADASAGAPRLTLAEATGLIDGLYVRDQNGTFVLRLSGDLGTYLRLLAQPRLHLLSRHPLPFSAPSGPVAATLHIHLPLEAHVRDEDIHIEARGAFHDVHLGDVLLGRDLADGAGTIFATQNGLDVTGTGRLGGVATTANVREKFRHDTRRDEVTRIHAVSTFDPASFEAAGLGSPDLFTGQAVLTSDYVARADGRGDVALALDLGAAGVSLPVWDKAPGLAASARAHVALMHDTVTGVDGIVAQGPELALNGHAVLDKGGIVGVALEDFHVRRSKGDARILFGSGADAPLRVMVNAETLDLAPLFHRVAAGSGERPVRERPAGAWRRREWKVDLKARRLFLAREAMLGGVSAHLEEKGGRLLFATVESVAPAETHVVLTPRGRERHLVATTADLGAMLDQLAGIKRIGGGAMRLEGALRDEQNGAGGLTFEGRLTGAHVALLHPPAALTWVTHLAPYDRGVADGAHFEFRDISLPVTYRAGRVTIRDGQLGNDALGATVTGDIDTVTERIDLRGTLVPLFSLNALPGKLPGLGKLFVPEKGGGMLAATFAVKGALGDPSVHVNPFSMLLPGVLRGIAE
ncbi:YhdP family protein [Acidomonas methanolica]|uniref:YhdP family protein n=1 Tax=Acidomonas methanolica TaxID=437 RepID=UPI00104B7C5E|nr:AsmA-like C-terminal region-containing protein [Acidomonas methanolica]MBU2654873.1 DUF3971 domain-containing protein [Acidomonas methanolica]